METKKITAAIDTFLDTKVVPMERNPKLAIAAAVLVVPVILFYFLVYSPNTTKIAKAQRQVRGLEKDLREIKEKAARLGEHKRLLAEIEAEYEQASVVIPDNKEIPSLLSSISSEGSASGLDIISFVPGAEVGKDFYAEIPVKLQVTGTYHNLGHFLDTVSKMPRIVNVSSVALSAPKAGGGKMQLTAGVDLVTYKFIDRAPTDKKKGGKKRGKK